MTGNQAFILSLGAGKKRSDDLLNALAIPGPQDSAPYLFRKTAGDANDGTIGTRKNVSKLVGGTIAWNQLFQKVRASASLYGLTITKVNDTTLTISGTASSTVSTLSLIDSADAVARVPNHIYCILGIPNSAAAHTSGTTATSGEGGIFKWTSDGNVAVGIGFSSGAVIDITCRPQVLDLTQMFGATVADYIYSLETANAGAGVSWFRALFPKTYYAPNTGELMSVRAAEHITRDADENIIGAYPLDSSLELRGVPKLDANKQLYFDGDVYASDGTVKRRFAQITLDGDNVRVNNVNYYQPTDTYFLAFSLRPALGVGYGRVFTAPYYERENVPGPGIVYMTGDGVSLVVCLYDQTITTNEAADAWLTTHPITVIYELAESTTESAAPYANPQIIDPNGTEEFVDAGERDVAVPVGHETQYLCDTKAYIDKQIATLQALVLEND